MFPEPRVIAVDDELEHLEILIDAFRGNGWYCHPIHFSQETLEVVPECRHVRIIFTDLHLVAGNPTDNHNQNFNSIAVLIDQLKPAGPYLIILWSRYSDEATNLNEYLNDRLNNLPKPLRIECIDKEEFIRKGQLENSNKLVNRVKQIFEDQPEISALLNWERKVAGAAGETVSSILDLARGHDNLNDTVSTLLFEMAVGAVGLDHVNGGKFRAVNEALLPILADRIANLRSEEDSKVWNSAFQVKNSSEKLTANQIAELNQLLHIDLSLEPKTYACEPGIVIKLPPQYSGKFFRKRIDLEMQEAATKQFSHKGIEPNAGVNFQWVLVYAPAACDHAQIGPGLLPYYLGLLLTEDMSKPGSSKKAVWKSPCFRLDHYNYFLHVNSRFQISLAERIAKKQLPIFRLREQLLNQLIYHIHSYSARPGIIEIRKN